jgi:uncharacterized phiE125 gp8 family phage protein
MATLKQKDGILIRSTRGALPVSVADAKLHLRVDHDTEDDYIEALIRAVQDDLEPPNGWLGRALMEGTYQLILPKFAEKIVLPAPPLLEVSSITYLDEDGAEQTASTDLYRVLEGEPSVIQLLEDEEWPGTDTVDDAVVIEYTAGYEALPEIIKAYILLSVAQLYEYRSLALGGAEVKDVPGFRHMLSSWRVY